jgi:hypothetical protein
LDLRLSGLPLLVMPGLVPGIHVLTIVQQERRGWPGIAVRRTASLKLAYARP